MLEITLLGTGGMMPLPGRYLTALMVRHSGKYILIDCGEGTQMAARAVGLGFKQIGTICFTHFHADHIAGLPGMLLTIGNAGRSEPLLIIGPQGIQHVVACLRVIAPELPYEIEFIEINEHNSIFQVDALRVSAHPVAHALPCYAYKLELDRQGKFNPAKAKELEIPVRYWSVLQGGSPAEVNGRKILPSAVLGGTRKGIKLCYATDLRPSDTLVEFVRGADLFICEAIYGDPEKQEKAIKYGHCMFEEAALIAKNANVKELWLTHFSPSLTDPQQCLAYAADIFQNTWLDKQHAILRFIN